MKIDIGRPELERKVKGRAVLLLTGLPAAGKTTLAQVLEAQLKRSGCRVAVLDGDAVRARSGQHLGYTRRDRERQLQRVAELAAEAALGGAVVLCALIAPYRSARETLRSRVSSIAPYYEIHVATTLEVCERRDPKGHYAAARSGAIPHFTGVSDPYEVPDAPALSLDLGILSAQDAATAIINRLARDRVIKATTMRDHG